MDHRRWAEAEAECRLALASECDRALAFYWLAWVQMRQEKFAEGLQNAERAIVEDPERGGGYHARALILDKQGDRAEAEKAIRTAIQKDPYTPEYRSDLGWMIVYRRAGDALEAVNEGLKHSPEHASLHQVRTEALGLLKQAGAAEESARKALALAPENAVSHAQLAAIEFRKKNYEAAEKLYAEALRINPGYTYAREGLVKALRARTWIYRIAGPQPPRTKTPPSFAVSFVSGLIGLTMLIRFAPQFGAAVGLILLAIAAFFLVRFYLRAIANPVSTLLIRRNPLGRAALASQEVECSDYAVMLLGGALAALVAGVAGARICFLIGLYLLLLMVPMAKSYELKGRRQKLAQGYTWFLFSMAAFSVAAFVSKHVGAGSVLVTVFIYGLLLFQFVLGALFRLFRI